MLVVAALLSQLEVPVSRYVPMAWTVPRASPLIDAFNRWDATNYLRIAADGYTTAHPSDAAFFPLFPALVRVAASLAGPANPVGLSVAAIVVANVALLAAVSGLLALARFDLDSATARRTGWAVFVFPTSLFLSAGYAESLFLALSVGAYLACRRDRWLMAGGLAAGAALTRPFGVVVILPLAVEWAIRWRAGERHRRDLVAGGLAALAMVAVGMAAFMAILDRQVGDPLAFVHAQASWGRGVTLPWDTFGQFFGAPLTFNSGEHAFVDLAFTVLFGALVVATWRWLRPALALFTTALLVVPLSTGSLVSMPRFVLAAFPVFLVLALAARSKPFELAYIVIGVGLGAVWMGLIAQWYWVA